MEKSQNAHICMCTHVHLHIHIHTGASKRTQTHELEKPHHIGLYNTMHGHRQRGIIHVLACICTCMHETL